MKTVVTDLDGTLLNNGKLSIKTIQILKEFQKQNRLILATGRNLHSVKQIYQQLDMEHYQSGALIMINGLETYDFHDQEYRSLGCLNNKDIKKIIFIAYILLFRITIVSQEERVDFNSLYDRIYYVLRYIVKRKPMKKFTKQHIPHNVQKIELGGTIAFSFFLKVLKILLKSYEIVKVNDYWVEILPKGTNKNKQLQYFIDKYNISSENLYVFGDGENDVEMLKKHYNSFAPKNAMKIAKQAARFECENCTNDGVTEIIEMYLIKK